MCIAEEHSFCSTINSHSESDVDSELDLNLPNGVHYDGEEGRAGEAESGGGGSRGVGDMSVVSDRDYRVYDNGRNEELGQIKWKGRGKRRSGEKTGGGVFHSMEGKNNNKKSGELWMKNQKNCVLQE